VVTAVYLDASAIVRWLSREPGWERLEGIFGSRPRHFSSRIVDVEVRRVLARNQASDAEALLARADALLARINLVELTPSIASEAATVRPPTLRSLDAIHLASFLTLRPEVKALVTYDVRLADAARSVGAQAESP
jgi:uncharacterized protein